MLKALCSALEVIYLDHTIVEKVIAIRKNYKIKLPDSIILATAVEKGMTLVARNVDDFIVFPGADLFNPFEKGDQ